MKDLNEAQVVKEMAESPPKHSEMNYQTGSQSMDPHWEHSRKWHRNRSLDDPRGKSPALAAFLSVMPGLGQVYTGYYQQGFINVVVVGSLISIVQQDLGPIHPLAVFFMIFYWLFNIVDAYRRAAFYNQALSGLGPMEFPEQPQPPDAKGALLGGVLLTGFGLVALAHTIFDLSTVWLEDWWPGILVLIGGYLIVQSVLTKRKEKAG